MPSRAPKPMSEENRRSLQNIWHELKLEPITNPHLSIRNLQDLYRQEAADEKRKLFKRCALVAVSAVILFILFYAVLAFDRLPAFLGGEPVPKTKWEMLMDSSCNFIASILESADQEC